MSSEDTARIAVLVPVYNHAEATSSWVDALPGEESATSAAHSSSSRAGFS